MPQIPDRVEFCVVKDDIEFSTKSNGDRMRIHDIHMDRENAAALVYLVNSGINLCIEIKEKGT